MHSNEKVTYRKDPKPPWSGARRTKKAADKSQTICVVTTRTKESA